MDWKESNSLLRNVVFDGNSLTVGGEYSSKVLSDLYAIRRSYNVAVGGQTTADMISRATSFVDTKLENYYRNIVVAWEGTNDLYFGADAATAYNNLVTYCQARQAAGWKVVIVTLLPRSNSGTPGSFEADRQTVNANIRNNWPTFADALADVAADARIGNTGDETDTAYYSDLVHLTTAGYNIVAGIVGTAIQAIAGN